MDLKKYALGCIPNKPDDRDYIFAPTKASAASFPEEFRLADTIVKNQGEVGSCMAHSISIIKEIQEFYETKNKLVFSVGWLYGYRVDGQYKGEGMHPREALNNLIKYGDVLQADFPENLEYDDIQKLISKRRAVCLQKGKRYRCKAYAKVTSVSDVKSCLYINHSPVMICCDIYDNFYKTTKNGVVSASMQGANNGNHAMTIVGWKDSNWIVQNSWGKEFGDNGYCYISMYARYITDMFTVTDMQNILC